MFSLDVLTALEYSQRDPPIEAVWVGIISGWGLIS
jgi:hypothetical protein